MQALDRLQASDREAASLMRSLLDELTEAYSRLREGIDPDTVDLLDPREVRNLRDHLDPDVVDQLARTTRQLATMKSTLDAFSEAAPALRRLPPNRGGYR